jgi:paraquat-inducible protein B
MRKKLSPTLIGAFVVGALTLLITGLMLFGSGPLFRKSYEFVIFFDSSVSGLKAGAPVKFRGVEVGAVKGVFLDLPHLPADYETSAIPVIVEIYEDEIRHRGGRADLDDPEAMSNLIERGLRAQLQSESLVTGMQYIALDVHPGSPVVFFDLPGSPYQEIPHLPTAFAALQQQLARFVNELSEIDLDSISESINGTLAGVSNLVNSPTILHAVASLDTTLHSIGDAVREMKALAEDVQANVIPMTASIDSTREKASIALEEATATMAAIRMQLEPGSPLTYELQAALRELSEASRAMTEFVEYLERNPGALVRGREVSEKENE